MPIIKLKIPMMLAMRTTANHLFCCVNQFSILVFDKAKSSLVRCTFSSLATHSTISLNGISIDLQEYIQSKLLHPHMILPANLFTVRITGFSDSNTSETVNWSSWLCNSLPFAFSVLICIWPSICSFSGICVP